MAALVAAAAACGGEAPGDDARVIDARVIDARVIDAAVIDAAAIDAAAIDAPLVDARDADGQLPDDAAIDALATDGPATDAAATDAAAIDALATDAAATDAPALDAPGSDGGYQCDLLDLTPAQACAVALTGRVTACAIDADGVPSQTAALDVRRPDGAHGYLCATVWTAAGGFEFGNRHPLLASASRCCGGPSVPQLAWPATDPYFGVPHGATRIKPHEMQAASGGDLRHNPFAVIVSSAASAAAFNAARANWMAWSGDGQPHPGPDGTGSYWFPAHLVVNYVLVPTAAGAPLIIIAPEPSLDPAFTQDLGHPSLGVCPGPGGAPMAFLGGDIRNTTLTNGSGRFGYESTVTAAHLDNTARLFNCYGIPITDVIYSPPS